MKFMKNVNDKSTMVVNGNGKFYISSLDIGEKIYRLIYDQGFVEYIIKGVIKASDNRELYGKLSIADLEYKMNESGCKFDRVEEFVLDNDIYCLFLD